MDTKKDVESIKALLKTAFAVDGEVRVIPFDVGKAYFAFKQKPLPAKTTIFELNDGKKGKFYISMAKETDFQPKEPYQKDV